MLNSTQESLQRQLWWFTGRPVSKSHSSSSPWLTVSLCQLQAFRFRFADTQHYLLIPPPTLIDRWPSGLTTWTFFWTDDEVGLSVSRGGLSWSEMVSVGLRHRVSQWKSQLV